VDANVFVAMVMIILYPENSSNKTQYLDFHAHPFGLYEHNSVIPVLGTQSILVQSNGLESSLSEAINRLFEVVVDKEVAVSFG